MGKASGKYRWVGSVHLIFGNANIYSLQHTKYHCVTFPDEQKQHWQIIFMHAVNLISARNREFLQMPVLGAWWKFWEVSWSQVLGTWNARKLKPHRLDAELKRQNLALSSLLSYGKSRHEEKPHIWDSLDPDRYVGIETKFCFRTVNTYLTTCQTVFVHIHKITFKWLATMQVYIFPWLLSQKHFSLQ